MRALAAMPGAYDARQVRVAERALDDYLASRRSLADLGRLTATLGALELRDGERQAALDEHVLTLETVYATRLDRGGELDDADASVVGEAVERLRTLVAA